MNQRQFVRTKFVAGISRHHEIRAAQHVSPLGIVEIHEITDFRNIADGL
jgi:hypothetical protein